MRPRLGRSFARAGHGAILPALLVPSMEGVEPMAYKFQRNGETIIKFERGKWDSFWGYQCQTCWKIFTDPGDAHDHENAQDCSAPTGTRKQTT